MIGPLQWLSGWERPADGPLPRWRRSGSARDAKRYSEVWADKESDGALPRVAIVWKERVPLYAKVLTSIHDLEVQDGERVVAQGGW